jgi:hypothetical protein
MEAGGRRRPKLLAYAEQCFRFLPESKQLGVVGGMLVHPLDGPLIRLSSLVAAIEVRLGHRQEQFGPGQIFPLTEIPETFRVS